MGEPRHFSRNVADSLLLLFQEAVNNALRHGEATRVEAEVLYGTDELELRVTAMAAASIPAMRREPVRGISGSME